jgi:hypothetical protein
VEGLDFGEAFAPVAHLKAIRMLLAFAAYKAFKLYQKDVKSMFLNSVIQEVVFVRQPIGFENSKYLNRLYKLSKALYGLKQACRLGMLGLRRFYWSMGLLWGVSIRPYLLLIMALTFYLFRFTWTILSLVALLTLLCPDFRKW